MRSEVLVMLLHKDANIMANYEECAMEDDMRKLETHSIKA
jgi:hypothetical protein